MQLEGKVAVITGGSSGIGQATAELFAQSGAKVAIVGLSSDDLQETVNKIQQQGGEILAFSADVSKPEQIQAVMKQTGDRWGRIDIVLANAGINGVWAPLEELDPDEWDQTIDINLKGTFLTVKYAVPYLKRQGGAVVVMSSVNGTRMFSNTGATAYACSKAAQVAFTKMVALELAKDRIRVNVVCPGAISTDINESTDQQSLEGIRLPVKFPEGQIPLTDGKSGTSMQVAQLVLFLASDASSHITGTEMWIDGGQSLLQG
ncbi:SDR family oxidoreductase [Oculatella sp. LEGE 06141]|uniref:SDR family oxidoreductase n=1 Tax=Oculatella sp. LEGE 06141 TaxID=1828648 RepID=UPI0018825196|nr:SDR family NAD(P)-dependent oxidoreductase [Oculatella sp. LEGE 06141]MBE9180407.1 SDR family oxidoreductase [Oculatella sp. LEGE 06141]